MSQADYAEVQKEYESELAYFLFTLDDKELEEFRSLMKRHINRKECATKRLKFATKKRHTAHGLKFAEQLMATTKVYCEFALKWPLKVHRKFYK